MKRAVIERNIVVVLFILVLIAFSFAERDTKKLDQLYTKKAESLAPEKKEKSMGALEDAPAKFNSGFSRN
jgi:hypothetical protein